jgi:hypothetical protein
MASTPVLGATRSALYGDSLSLHCVVSSKTTALLCRVVLLDTHTALDLSLLSLFLSFSLSFCLCINLFHTTQSIHLSFNQSINPSIIQSIYQSTFNVQPSISFLKQADPRDYRRTDSLPIILCRPCQSIRRRLLLHSRRIRSWQDQPLAGRLQASHQFTIQPRRTSRQRHSPTSPRRQSAHYRMHIASLSH